MNEKLKAKMEVLKELKQKAKQQDISDLGQKLHGKIKKVVIAAPDEKGLEKGLSLAEQILAKRKEQEDFSDEEVGESQDEELSEDEQEEECPMCGEMHGQELACGGIKK